MFARPSQNPTQSKLLVDDLFEPPVWKEPASALGSTHKELRRTLRSVGHRDWIATLLYMGCDMVCWVVLYGIVGYVRRDQFFVSPFEFVLVDCVVLAVILQALYIIGGYNRNTEMRGLLYTAEHILAVFGAAAISSLLIYSAATFDAGMKPSRSVLLISFIFFLPISLTYRRFFRQLTATSAAQQVFLVIGSGELATRFYEAYRKSPNQQQLEFVDNDVARVGATIAGEGSPIVQGGIAARVAQLDGRYSGVIIAESIDRLGSKLLERLVRTQFQRTRVYTLESFYEAHWRHVPVHTIDPFWPLQMGFQLARISPYHYLKRLFDVALSSVLLVICFPLMAAAACLIWLTNSRPALFRQARVGREGEVFTIYKFRTMTASNDADEGHIYTRENDARV